MLEDKDIDNYIKAKDWIKQSLNEPAIKRINILIKKCMWQKPRESKFILKTQDTFCLKLLNNYEDYSGMVSRQMRYEGL